MCLNLNNIPITTENLLLLAPLLDANMHVITSPSCTCILSLRERIKSSGNINSEILSHVLVIEETTI
ncbi:conserved hypothetical protein [Ricinus communis]|uniref:Uncharacterized protein n=1 Tax=Ricinus communis TaxID=3988 RepID=B9T2U1_RICCO|nr:conserved hypothetical protein [Ricinus communis]